MHILKIKNQFNTIFVFIFIIALFSFFIASSFVNRVTTSYEKVLNNTLPILNKSSEVAHIGAQIESHLIQIQFNAVSDTEYKLLKIKEVDKLMQQWNSANQLLTDLSSFNIVNNKEIIKQQEEIQEYVKYTHQLFEQINLLVEAKKQEQEYKIDIETIINYNNRILLAEIESFWEALIKDKAKPNDLQELKHANQFYKNSGQILSYFRQTLLTEDIHKLNILKRNSVKLFKKMKKIGSLNYEYKLFAQTVLESVKPLYSGKHSLFKVRYDVLRLNNVTDSLIQQQINTVEKIEKTSNNIIIKVQDSLTIQKTKIKDDLNKTNTYFSFMIIIIFFISFLTIWLLVNKNLIKRITDIRYKILELSKGNTKIDIITHKKDEIGDMENALGELKGYVSKAKILSITDSLTGLLNNTQFRKNISIEIRRHTRHKQPLSLAIIDIDFFKNYNDAYGHPQGDECLRIVAKLIKECCHRAGENAFRIGGEEFAVLMPTTKSDVILNKLEDLRERLKKANIVHEKSTISNLLTLSIGVYCSHNINFLSSEEFYKKADIALYKAKITRDTIIIDEEEI